MKLRRFNKTKRLNEADDNAQQQPNNNQPTDQNQQNNNNNQPQQPAQNNNKPAEQTNNNQPQQPAKNNNGNNNQQDNNKQQQQQVDPEKQKRAEEVNAFLDTVRSNVQQNKIYWALANDFVGVVQKNIPDFKADNPAAKPGINAWETFKKDPSQKTFDAFINQLQTFAGVGQQQQPTAEQAQQEKAVNDSLVTDFGARLEKRLHEQLMIDRVSRQIQQGIYEAKHNI